MRTLRSDVTIMGNIGTEPQITNFENGAKIVRFRMLKNECTREHELDTDKWHRIFAWGNIANFIETYAQKGKSLTIHGREISRTVLGINGEQRTIKEVEVKHVIGI